MRADYIGAGLVLLALTQSSAAPVSAAEGKDEFAAVIDLTARGLDKATVDKLAELNRESAALSTERATLVRFSGELERLLVMFTQAAGPSDANTPDLNIDHQDQLARALSQQHFRSRLPVAGPVVLRVFLIVDSSDQIDPTIDEVKETERDLVILSDLRVVVNSLVPLAAETERPNVKVAMKAIDLVYARSDVSIVATSHPGGGGKELSKTLSIRTGPPEHLGLSVDLGVNRLDELKYDKETSAIVEKEAPGEFLVSVNWWLGDIATPANELRLSERVGLKLMVRGSRKPLDTVGAGVTVRIPAFELLGRGVGGLQPFGAAVWRREDKRLRADGTVDRGYGDLELVCGISFDVTKLADWWKKPKS